MCMTNKYTLLLQCYKNYNIRVGSGTLEVLRVRLEISNAVVRTVLHVKLTLRNILKAMKELNIACLGEKIVL